MLYQFMENADDFRFLHNCPDIRELADRWFTDQHAKAEVASILERFGLDESAIDAEAIRDRIPELEAFGRMIATAQRRYDQTLLLLGACRGGLGDQLRAATTTMIDRTVRALETGRGKKSAA